MINKDILDALKAIAQADKQYSQRDFLATMNKLSKRNEGSYWPSKQELISYFNKAISPYGYPNYQRICHKTHVYFGAINLCFDRINKVKTDKRKDGLLSQKISFDQDAITEPVLYMTDSLGEALFQTKEPDSVKLDRKFYNRFVIIFSNQFKRINWVWICFDEASSKLKYKFSYNYKGIEIIWQDHREFEGGKISQNASDIERKGNYQKIGCLVFALINKSGKSAQQICDEIDDEGVKCKEIGMGLTKDVLRFICNLILLSQQQPEILTVQDSRSKYVATDDKGFKSTKINKQTQVHWLGENFTTRVVRAAEVEGERQVGSPKRSHWRKGHWHTVLQGPGRKQKQMRWFQPTFIRGNGG